MATIIFYADNFDYALTAGEKSASELLEAASMIQKISTRSFKTYAQLGKTIDAVKSRTDMSNEIRFVKNKIAKDAYNFECFRSSFLGLFNLVDDWYSQTIDEYLTDNGLKVLPTFATNSSRFGQTISESNIRGY